MGKFPVSLGNSRNFGQIPEILGQIPEILGQIPEILGQIPVIFRNFRKVSDRSKMVFSVFVDPFGTRLCHIL